MQREKRGVYGYHDGTMRGFWGWWTRDLDKGCTSLVGRFRTKPPRWVVSSFHSLAVMYW